MLQIFEAKNIITINETNDKKLGLAKIPNNLDSINPCLIYNPL